MTIRPPAAPSGSATSVPLTDKTDSNNVIADLDYVTTTAAYDANQPGVITVFGGSTAQKHTLGDAAVGTISGGYDHELSDDATAGTIGGGGHNTCGGSHGTISGGSYNTIGAVGYATIGGGTANTASGIQSTVVGGANNTASGQSSIAGGSANTASATEAVALGGNNTASAVYATAIGKLNMASASNALATGYNALANKIGQHAHSAKAFSARGDAQTSVYVLSYSTTTGAAQDLFCDGASATSRLTLPNDSTWAFEVMVVGRRTDADDESAAYLFTGVIDRNANAASTALVGTPVKTVLAEDTAAWDCDVSARTTDGSLNVTVTGEAAKTIRWVAFVRTVEVTG